MRSISFEKILFLIKSNLDKILELFSNVIREKRKLGPISKENLTYP